jgi:hypothetical protein
MTLARPAAARCWCNADVAVRLGEAMLGWGEQVASVDVNPVMVSDQGRGALAVDALVELAPACAKPG